MNHLKTENQYCAQNYKPLPVVLTRGEGVWLWDDKGNKYLDMMSAYSAVSHGHSNPHLVKVLTEQAARLAITSRAFHNDKLGSFLEKLCQVSGFDKALPMNTGAEAVETAIKAARRWGYRVKGIPSNKAEIIVADQNFHGRTTTIISFSSEDDYKTDFGPLTPGFVTVPFGDAAALKAAITPNTCAVLFEPIQGEAGIRVPPQGWLRDVRNICDDNNVLMILDEIQSGLGRTGKMFAFEHDGIKPDGLTLGKALGGGLMPVSAFLADKEVMDVFNAGSHGSTFGGNPLAAAVGFEALKLLEAEGLVDQSAHLGRYLVDGLKRIGKGAFTQVRGKGLWVGVDLDPEVISAHALCQELMAEGLLTKETHETTIRFAPPLIIKKSEIDWALLKVEEVLKRFRPQDVEPIADAARQLEFV